MFPQRYTSHLTTTTPSLCIWFLTMAFCWTPTARAKCLMWRGISTEWWRAFLSKRGFHNRPRTMWWRHGRRGSLRATESLWCLYRTQSARIRLWLKLRTLESLRRTTRRCKKEVLWLSLTMALGILAVPDNAPVWVLKLVVTQVGQTQQQE